MNQIKNVKHIKNELPEITLHNDDKVYVMIGRNYTNNTMTLLEKGKTIDISFDARILINLKNGK